MPLEDDLGFVYIAEQTTPEENKMNNVKIHDGRVFFVEFDACLHTFDVMNRNQRQYLRSNIEECINSSEKIQSLLADNAWYGEEDHPMTEKEGDKLTPQRISNAFMPKRSHKIMRPKFDGNALYAHIQTASGTDAGKGFAAEIIQGLIPSFSCRALATLKLINGIPTVIVRKLITYDWVLYPSHKEAKIISMPQGISKGIQTVTESVQDTVSRFGGKIKKASEDILLPLKEIMEYVGHKDVTSQIIMEAFELDASDMIGFDENKNHAIFIDGNNTIYAKMDPKTVKEVHNFYESFSL